MSKKRGRGGVNARGVSGSTTTVVQTRINLVLTSCSVTGLGWWSTSCNREIGFITSDLGVTIANNAARLLVMV